MNWGISDIKSKFKWINANSGAKLEGVSSSNFWNHIVEEFNVDLDLGTAIFKGGEPIFRIASVPFPSGHCIWWATTYPDSNSGFNFTIAFYTGPCTSTTYSQLSQKFKIRFDD